MDLLLMFYLLRKDLLSRFDESERTFDLKMKYKVKICYIKSLQRVNKILSISISNSLEK